MFEMFETTNQIPSTAVDLNKIEIGMGSDLLRLVTKKTTAQRQRTQISSSPSSKIFKT